MQEGKLVLVQLRTFLSLKKLVIVSFDEPNGASRCGGVNEFEICGKAISNIVSGILGLVCLRCRTQNRSQLKNEIFEKWNFVDWRGFSRIYCKR